MKNRRIRMEVWLIALAAFVQAASGEEKSIPKTGEPLMVEAKKKPHHEWQPKETYTLRQLIGYEPKPDPATSRYGGMTGTQFPATGFFYTRKYNGRWWLVDPEGHLCIHKAVCSVGPGGSENFRRNLKKKFGSEEAWAEATTQYLRELGFNGTAAWSKNDLLRGVKNRPVYTQSWNFMASYAKQRGTAEMGSGNHKYTGDVIYVFDPEFEAFANEYARQLAEMKDDPWLLGHFSDNELPLRPHALELCLKLDKSEPGYRAALAWLQERKGREEVGIEDATDEDRDAFYGYYLDRYYSVVSSAIKKHDPNHLYLGSRLIGVSDNETAMRTYAKHVDVMSINWYGAWLLEKERMDNWAKWTDKPFIISEWYAKGHDVPGLTNESGAGWLVHTQKERGYYYQNMALNLMARKHAVGWHWFKYADNDPEDLTTDPSNRNSNKGIVNVEYEPYTALVDAMRELNTQAYRLIEFFDDTSYAKASAAEERKGKFFGTVWKRWDCRPEDSLYYDELFDQVTPEGCTKLRQVSPARGEYNWEPVDAMYEYARARGWPVKQHTFFWKAFTNRKTDAPEWFEQLVIDAKWDDVREAVYAYMRAYFTRYPQTAMADITNETAKNVPVLGQHITRNPDGIIWWHAFLEGGYTNGEYRTHSDEDYRTWEWLLPIYRKAREITSELAPDVQLLINDHTILREDFRRGLLIDQVKLLQSEDLVDGIGLQGHHVGDLSPLTVWTALEDLRQQTGLPLYISELDIRDNEHNDGAEMDGTDETQLQYAKNVFPSLWEHPSVQGITWWGYMGNTMDGEKMMWRPTAWMVANDGSFRPAWEWIMKYKHGSSRLLKTEIPEGTCGEKTLLPGQFIKFENVAMDRFKIIVAKYAIRSEEGGRIELRLDSASGTLLGTIPLADTGGLPCLAHADLLDEQVDGIRDVCFVFRGSNAVCFVDWFKFRGGTGGDSG